MAGLQVGDRVAVPGPGVRLSRTVLASNCGGALYVDNLKNRCARTVPLVSAVVPIVQRWAEGKASDDWLFSAPEGGPPREPNWRRSTRWSEAITAIDRSQLRVHDLRPTVASMWLGPGADPKVVQRVLGHASAAMTIDLYGHLIEPVGRGGTSRGHSGTRDPSDDDEDGATRTASGSGPGLMLGAALGI